MADKGGQMKLWKTTVVIWGEYNGQTVELEELARDATSGESYCARYQSVFVPDVEADPDWDGTEFFVRDREEEDRGDRCNECGADIPSHMISEVNEHHDRSCSLHPSAVDGVEGAEGWKERGDH